VSNNRDGVRETTIPGAPVIVGSVPTNFPVTCRSLLAERAARPAGPVTTPSRAWVTRSALTWAGVHVGWSWSTIAAAPLVSGAENEVPDPSAVE